MATATATAVVAATNDAEAQFLEARKARTETARLHTERRRRTDDLQDFWVAFKAFRSAWTRKLKQIQVQVQVQGEHVDTDTGASASESACVSIAVAVVVSESDKRRIHLEFCRLQDELEYRRKQCFSHNSNAREQQLQQLQIDSASSFPAFTLPAHELPLSDLRLLHAEFTQCRAELDRKRNHLLPKGKFVFSRYRKAMAMQLLQGQQEEDADALVTINSNSYPTTTELRLLPVSVAEPEPPTCMDNTSVATTTLTARHDSKHTLENFSNCEIQVYTGGRVHVVSVCSKKNEDDSSMDMNMNMNMNIQLEALDSAPLVLSNIQNSNVVIYDGSCSALHLFQVSHSTVTVERPVRSVHVTACHQVQLHLQSQQLRLHESTDLGCHVKISAGAILEDCTRVTFYTTNDDSSLDVRDFNWLRSGVPSPNYSVVVEKGGFDGASFAQSFRERNVVSSKEQPPTARSNDAASASVVSEAQAVQTAKQDDDDGNNDDDDDDDEL